MPRLSITRTATLTVGALGLVMAVGGCRAHDTAPSPTPPPSVSGPAANASTSTDPIVSARGGALAAYRGMWAAYATAGAAANPDEPTLARYAHGDALTTLVTGLRSVKDRGLVTKGAMVLRPQVTSLSPADTPTEVGIRDCADDSAFLLYKRSGHLLNDTPGGRHLVLATVTRLADGWKVTSFGVQEVGTC